MYSCMYYTLDRNALLCICDIKFYVAQVLHGQICLIPKDCYVFIIIL